MRGAAVGIDIGAVRIVVDHIGFCTQGIKNTLGNSRRASVGTVQSYFDILEIPAGDVDQIANIAVSSGSEIDGTSNILLGSQRKFFDLPIQISLDPLFDLCFDLLSVSVEKFDPVVIKRIVAAEIMIPQSKSSVLTA